MNTTNIILEARIELALMELRRAKREQQKTVIEMTGSSSVSILEIEQKTLLQLSHIIKVLDKIVSDRKQLAELL